ncbi:TetR/AcrR family transcriptional regulator [Streptomyces sp. YC504]|uniref:TetR/AcrR family transcriptional regulator n=1 Tax=Streptomyces mesophilus TaxID=1775132 RepID=A0A6G4XGQ0_9ACTN|nr:TetR/AcrR family transcriptional regulator [Streptomyces mesophilus]NGO75894.1 TetR/AcrR family transcriptional regulator [Streptomyces mesophilus]
MSPEQRRTMLVQATIPLVIAYGRAVTTRHIAQAAGVGEGTIFRVFADKDELLDACVTAVLGPGNTLAELAAIDLAKPLPERLTEAAEALRADLDRMGAVLGALHIPGAPRPQPRAGREQPRLPDRAAAMASTRDALADLFAPERDALRLTPERTAQLFLGLLLTEVTGGGEAGDIAELVDVFLHGALTPDAGKA